MGRILWNILWKVLPWLLVVLLLIRPTLDATSDIGRLLAPLMPVQPQQAMPLNPIASNPATQMVDEQTIVRQVNDIFRIETVNMVISTTFKLTNNEASTIGSWWNGETLQMRAVGTVIAGIDLKDVSDNDIEVSENGRQVTISLPEVKILSLTLDQEQTQPVTYEKGVGLIFKSGIDMTEQAYAVAQDNILREACKSGIMDKSVQNAITEMTNLIKAFNPVVQEVEVTVKTSDCLSVSQ